MVQMVDTVLWVEDGGEAQAQKILLGGIFKRINNNST